MKVLLVATVQSHICQFHRPLVAMLHEHGCEVHVAARNNLAEKNGLKLDFVEQVFDVPFQRSPFSPKNLGAYKQLKKIVGEGSYDVVHCNTPVGGVVGRLAARKARKRGTKVFYTAHGFHFYKGAPKKNWLIWYPVEKFMCRHTDKLITITQEDYGLASAKFPTQVERIHGVGANSAKYRKLSEAECAALRCELGYAEDEKNLALYGRAAAQQESDYGNPCDGRTEKETTKCKTAAGRKRPDASGVTGRGDGARLTELRGVSRLPHRFGAVCQYCRCDRVLQLPRGAADEHCGRHAAEQACGGIL